MRSAPVAIASPLENALAIVQAVEIDKAIVGVAKGKVAVIDDTEPGDEPVGKRSEQSKAAVVPKQSVVVVESEVVCPRLIVVDNDKQPSWKFFARDEDLSAVCFSECNGSD